ncbi:ariadne RING finger, putative [Entamoeba invadens IP1]|uniref:RBR-type E3 ubiquitin transferase n=1 Tax=Entamoeba invadens IP1 TaxID=370355 RepID=A0A0A1TU68_ENTIV|nr:ariadne RING finger, putative [Entamoeba invadens IP1]ELP83465.1 ariadne RING finger, putative [Entamoeba invadens IP1]|eukprot:XP_004182811.1 ariadne RING finger, putative [Entamoeba invadens IP1]
MDAQTKRIIDSLPLSTYRKKMKEETECLDRSELLKVIESEVQGSTELFDIVEPITLSLIYDFDFKSSRLQEKFFDDDNFLKKCGYSQKTREWYAPKEQCFPADYTKLAYKQYGTLFVSEESVNSIMSRGFNKVIATAALMMNNNNEEDALQQIRINLHKLIVLLKNELQKYRGRIAPPLETATAAPLLDYSKEFYYDLATRLPSEKEIIQAVSNEKNVPKDMRVWFNQLQKRFEEENTKREKMLETSGVTCDVCYEDKLPEEMMTNRCGHTFCVNCIRDHILSGMKESGKTIGNLRCLSGGCKCCICMDVVRKLVDDYTYFKYCGLLITGFIENNKQIICKYCNNNKCTKLLHFKGEYFGGAVTAVCDCETDLCLLCGSDNHRPASCDMWKKWTELLKKDGLNLKWIRENSRPCPKCGTFIEKNGGCQWMSCYKCHSFFCWVCMQVTNDHQHKPTQTCKPYNPNKEKDAHDYVNEETLNYITHYDLQNVGVKQSIERNHTIVDIIRDRKDISSTLAPLYEASLVEIDAHVILRNLCVYGCYQRSKKDLIEFQQTKFQMQAELLTKKIQMILKAEVISIEMMSQLSQFVKPIKDSFEKITHSIEEELEDM